MLEQIEEVFGGEKKKLEKQLKEEKEKLEKMVKDLEEEKEKADGLARVNALLEGMITGLNEQVARLTSEVDTLKIKGNSKDRAIGLYQAKIAEQAATITEQAATLTEQEVLCRQYKDDIDELVEKSGEMKLE